MTLNPVAPYLIRFDEPRTLALATEWSVARARCDEEQEEEAQASSAEMGAGLAFDAKEEEIRAAARAEFEAELALERARFAEEMARARDCWTSEEGGRLANEVQRAISDCQQDLREAVGRILAPFVAKEILERLLGDFLDTLRAAASDANNPLVELCGPTDLLDVIKERINEEEISVRFMQGGSGEVKAKIGFTSIETRIEEWLRRIRSGE